MKYLFSLLILVMSCAVSAEVAVKELDLHDNDRNRPVKLRVWYPLGSACDANICLPEQEAQKNLPVTILSHGAFGSPREYNWLGFGLASRGFLVIGVAHFQESWLYGAETIDRTSVTRLSERTGDLAFVLAALQGNKLTNVLLDEDHTILIGHSLGGFTALSLLGAKFSSADMYEYCRQDNIADRGCHYRGKQKPQHAIHENKPQKGEYDAVNISHIILLDPALGPGVKPTSLQKIEQPTLIVGSKHNDFLSFEHHAKRYANLLPLSELVRLDNNEGHFVYLDSCEHTHQAMGVSLCKDREGVNRDEVHDKVMHQIIRFLK